MKMKTNIHPKTPNKKTIEIFEKWKGFNYKPLAKIDTDDALMFAEHFAESQRKEWISVEDRLPTEIDADDYGKVLVWRKMNQNQIHQSISIHDYTKVKHLDNSSYWMELPELPKTKKDESST